MSDQLPLLLQQPFLRTKEAARFIGVSSRTLEKHRSYGTGPKFSKIGGRIIYAFSDLTEWVEHYAKRSTTDRDRKVILPPVNDLNLVVEPVSDSAMIIAATGTAISGTPAAARFLGMPCRTLEKHRISGTGPRYSKDGRRIIYTIDDLREWAERGATRSTSDPATVLPAKGADELARCPRSDGDQHRTSMRRRQTRSTARICCRRRPRPPLSRSV